MPEQKGLHGQYVAEAKVLLHDECVNRSTISCCSFRLMTSNVGTSITWYTHYMLTVLWVSLLSIAFARG